MELRIDPERISGGEETGIFVRAKDSEGHWQTADIVALDKPSLHHWLRSRGGENLFAENVVASLLGHTPFDRE